MVKQGREFLEKTKYRQQKPEILMHDRDTKSSKAWTETLEKYGVRINPLPVASLNLNGRYERSI